MPLIVEDGTGMATAEAYVSVADADARQTALGITAWTGSNTVKEQALRRATAFMEQRYRSRWKGSRVNSTQALSWPRYGVIVDEYYQDSDEVPTEVANACADLAVLSLTETLNPTLTQTVIREKVGPIETEYAPGSSAAKRWVAVEQALAPFFKMGASSVALVTR